jgi:excisionase family DNA binding protein
MQLSEKSEAPLAYRVKHFCQAVGLGKTKFYELVREGRIRTVVIGGRRLIPADEARRLVREASPVKMRDRVRGAICHGRRKERGPRDPP